VKRTLFLRAEGNQRIGLGHVTRCLSLAEMLKADWDIRFAIHQPDEFILSQIKAIGAECERLAEPGVQSLLQKINPGDVVVLDGYDFNSADENALRNAGVIVVAIDDFQHRRYEADWVLNYCGGLNRDDFNLASHSQLCLGPDFLILRKAFLELAHSPQQPVDPGIVFVSPGGSDALNIGGGILETLCAISGVREIHFLTGVINPHLAQLQSSAWNRPVHFHAGLNSNEIVAVLRQCGMAVTSASVSAWEVACAHLPLCIIDTADNQREVHRYFVQQHLALPFSHAEGLATTAKHILTNTQMRTELTERLKQTFKGNSDAEIRRLFNSFS
jgi:UDP-2,4-diacetamido-2,4,6-trideoxy-beta-L-altropyranose hydrolase